MNDRRTFIDGVEIRPIPIFKGRYAAAADGRIWHYPRTWITGKNGYIKRSHSGGWMKIRTFGNGYQMVKLSNSGKSRSYGVHRLVAWAWLPNPLNKAHVNHINGLRHDNRVVNLDWVSPLENTRHAVKLYNSIRSHLKAARSAVRGSVDSLDGLLLTMSPSLEASNDPRI